MERVGIRDLKQRASAVIRRVSAGEEIEVTDRGRPVARIVPIRRHDDYERLIADGEVTAAGGRLLDSQPAPALPGRALSQVLEELRADDDR